MRMLLLVCERARVCVRACAGIRVHLCLRVGVGVRGRVRAKLTPTL